jgi:DNA-damage-inducible protein J
VPNPLPAAVVETTSWALTAPVIRDPQAIQPSSASPRSGEWRRMCFALGENILDLVLRMQHITFMKTAAVHSRIQPEIKEKAEGILQRLGLSPTEAIRMFYTQIALRNGLPFDVAIPNDVTIKALEDSRNGRNLERFDSTEELFKSWDA